MYEVYPLNTKYSFSMNSHAMKQCLRNSMTIVKLIIPPMTLVIIFKKYYHYIESKPFLLNSSILRDNNL